MTSFFVNCNDAICKSPKELEVSSVAVTNGDFILMGRRKDSGRWTLPGGHLDPNEDPATAARRELLEEAYIKAPADHFDHLGEERVLCEDKKYRLIHAYQLKTDGPPSTPKYDPDGEVYRWQWISFKNGLPKRVSENLHSPKNIVLELMGIDMKLAKSKRKVGEKKFRLIKSEGFYVQDDVLGFTIDILKAAPHKYIRKFRRGGKWIYIYHEGDAHGKEMKPEAIKHIKELAETGHAGAHALHSSIEAHNEDKLKILRELADTGHSESHAHLKRLGIDRKAERLEEDLLGVTAGGDELDKELEHQNKLKLQHSITKALDEKIFNHLNRQTTSPFYRTMTDANISRHKLMEGVVEASARGVRGALKKLHENLKALDAVHPAASTSAQTYVKDAGGYANAAYNEVVVSLERQGLLPTGYGSVHKRAKENRELTEMPSPDDLAAAKERERVARAERERAEREAREAELNRRAGELRGSMAHHMASLMSSSPSVDEMVRIDNTIKSIFGKSLKKEDWPYDFSGAGLTVKIKGYTASGRTLTMSFSVKDRDGNEVLDHGGYGWHRRWDMEDGKPHIKNSSLEVLPRHRKHRLGALINEGQRKMMIKHTTNGFITVGTAQIGNYNWANNGFRFHGDGQLRRHRDRFQQKMAGLGISMSREDLAAFTDPVHFAQFDDGKTYKVREMDVDLDLTPKQIETGFLDGANGQHRLTEREKTSGKSRRIVCSIGKEFMLSMGFSGIWSVADNGKSVPDKFATLYNNKETKKEASRAFGEGYKKVVKRVRAERSGAPTRGSPQASTPSAPTTTASMVPASSNFRMSQLSHEDRMAIPFGIRIGRTGNIRMSQANWRTVRAMNIDGLRKFSEKHRHRLGVTAQRKLRGIIRARVLEERSRG